MPKNTNHGGASYAGHTDVSPDDVSEPDWQPNADAEPAAELTEPADGDLSYDSIERPTQADKKADWVAYAVALGHQPDVMEGLTKAELIQLVDTRETSAEAGHAAGTGEAADPQ